MFKETSTAPAARCAKMSHDVIEGIIEQDGHAFARQKVCTTKKVRKDDGRSADFPVRTPRYPRTRPPVDPHRRERCERECQRQALEEA